MLSTNGDNNTATLFDRNSGSVRATIPTGKEPDAAQYDESTGMLFVMNGDSEDITFIDLRKAAAVASVPVGGKPEAAATDGKGRLYVNIEDKAEIAVIDIASRRLVAHYKLPRCEEPTGLAYDAASHSLISACHNHVAKVIDAGTGADRGTVAIGQGADGSIFDAQRRLAYISCMDGTLWIFPLSRDGKVGEVTKVSTAYGARTEALDVKTGRLYLPRAEYKTGADGERKRVPGTFEVLVVSP
jgi:DNA-binding beta-propeller fold protein YncE